MREIKFRAWDSETNKFICPLFYTGKFFEDHRVFEDFIIWEAPVDQYTGLKDKNGKEIYEGDLFKTNLERPYNYVEFVNGAFMLNCFDNGKQYYDSFVNWQGGMVDCEVIGNIYENPELIEEQK